MFTIEEDSGTFTGSLRRHNGYYAGDFTRNPMGTAGELSAFRGTQEPPVGTFLLRSPVRSMRVNRQIGS